MGQTVAGPCGTTITITNASTPAATDGKIVLKTTVVGYYYYIHLGIVGSEMTGEMLNTTAASQLVLTGLIPGTYNVKVYREALAGASSCGETVQTVTVGSGAFTTCLGTEIGGNVFHDANASGTREAGEGGAAGVTVNAYNTAGTLVGTQTSNAQGIFKYTGLAAGQSYRLEYSWSDGYLQSGALGSSSGSSVQFVNSGTCTANLGLNYPANYCQTTNPYVMTPCYVNGNPQAAAVAPLDVLVAFPYRAANYDFDVSSQNVTPTHVATASQIGATWGVAYQKTTKYAFTSAVLRRFAGFGPLGTGGIYKVNMATPTAPVTSNWIDIKTIGINTGNDTRNATVANTLSTAPGAPAWDVEAFNQIGKIGIGGIDFNDRGDTLWLINLADKKLYGIKNVAPSVTPTAANVIGGYTVALPAGYSYITNSNDFRPWAVKYYKGLVYVGAVCSGESTPWSSFNLRGYVLSFDPANPAAGFKYVTDFPLNYTRYAYGTGSSFTFQTWLTTATVQYSVAQPIVMDLEFDLDGSMIVALGDRGGLQGGNQNYYADPTATNTNLLESSTMGDILRFCKTGSTYIQSGVASCPNPTDNIYPTSEYYWGDTGPFTNSTINFNEGGAGSIAFLAGSGSVIETAQDTYGWYSGGTIAFSNKTGGDLWRYCVFDPSVPGASGKATGLGDIESLCDPAPIEIGNRVWIDTDSDGVQDAGEAGLSGIQIQLYQGATLISTVTTDANGNYKFTGLLPNTSYSISLALGQAALGSKPLSTANVGTNDLIDNDMTKVGNSGLISLTTGYYGDNNHTYDIGFDTNCNVTVSATGSNNCVGATAILTATGSSGSGSYSWSGPNSYTSFSQNPTITNAQLIHTGAYSVTFTKPNGCTATGSVQLNVYPKPVLVATGDNECVGANIDLNVTATGGSGFTYSWNGPSGFTSTSQNPIRTAATAAMAGTYTVTVTNNNNCSTTATVTVVVNTGCTYQCCPTGNLLTNGNFETESGNNFNTSFEGVPAIYIPSNNVLGVGPYSWIRGLGEPDDPTNFIGGWYLKKTGVAGEPYEGSHYIYLRGKNANGSVCYGNPVTVQPCKKYKICAKAAAWTPTSVGVQGAADVDFIFYYTDASNAVKVVFNYFTIPANTSGSFNDLNWAEYSWTFDVPNDYNGNGRIYASSYDNVDGVAFDDICFSIAGDIVPPTITATGDTKCVGGTINLTASGGSKYAWSGPNGFTSSLQNPTIANATLAMAGTYTVTVTGATYCLSTTTVNVVVNPMTDISIQPIGFSECVGGNLNLSVTASGVSVTYQWQSSPDNATWTNIVGAITSTYLPPSVSSSSVWYRVLVGSSSCAIVNSNSAQVVIVSDPSVSVTVPPTIVCVGANITLTATPTVGTGTCNVQWQSSPDGTTWTNISGAIGNTYNVISLGATTRYRAQLVSCTGNGCCN